MTVQTVHAQITDTDSPLQGEPLLIEWDGDNLGVAVRVNGRWWPIQLAPDLGDAA